MIQLDSLVPGSQRHLGSSPGSVTYAVVSGGSLPSSPRASLYLSVKWCQSYSLSRLPVVGHCVCVAPRGGC